MPFGRLYFGLDSLPLANTQEVNSALHKLHDMVSAWTAGKQYEAKGDTEMAEAYFAMAKRINDTLPDEWKQI